MSWEMFLSNGHYFPARIRLQGFRRSRFCRCPRCWSTQAMLRREKSPIPEGDCPDPVFLYVPYVVEGKQGTHNVRTQNFHDLCNSAGAPTNAMHK